MTTDPNPSPGPVVSPPHEPYKRPGSNWAQVTSACFSVVTALAAAGGLWKYTIDLKTDRERQAERAISQLYPLENELSRYLAEHVEMQVCLDDDKEGKRWKQQGYAERLQFRAVCAMVADELEYYLLIRDNILTHPRGADIAEAWDNNLKDYCRNSYGFRAYILHNPGVWTTMFRDKFKEHTKDLDPPDKDILPEKPPK